ncbi:alpha/beta hydrolase [Gammaproteobacteria bacterium ESL0073]|nr:alpha/beta hydrolase [Gammaproteobacteria bacterium ESL0073]
MSTQEIVLFINGPAGKLEALYCEQPDAKGIALICHPHPLYAGTMQNKVVATLQRTARDNQWSTLRFNFRGVGKSEGTYGEGVGETADAKAALEWLQAKNPNQPIIIMGFSFGSCVAACLAGQLEQQGTPIKQLVMIAPPVERFDIKGKLPTSCPLLVIQPEADEVVTPQIVYDWSNHLTIEHTLLTVPECSHFFHGRLTELKDLVAPYLQ